MGLHKPEEARRILYVLADGKLRENVGEGVEGAVKRTVKADDGSVKVEKWEKVYPGITGYITGVTLFDGEYGTNVQVAIKDENEEEFMLSLKASSKYGEDFLFKLPNVDFTKEITIKPYSFTDGERRVQGVTLSQNDTKLTNAYNWKDENGEWQNVDGFPQVDEKKKPKNSEQWMMFFSQRRQWVIDDLIEKGLITEATAEVDDSF